MKTLSLNSRKIEVLVYTLVWLLVFSVPFFVNRDLHQLNWHRLANEWIHLSCYLLVFLLNVFWLVPRLLLNKKYFPYIIASVALIFLVIGINIFLRELMPLAPGLHPGPPPGGDFPAPPAPPGPPGPMRKPLPIMIIDCFIITLLIIGAGTAVKLVTQWLEEEKLRKDIEKEQLKTNLALLRNQVSPHFFMNTLNNIHALIDINSEDAKNAIIRLSTLMRYLLYDSARGQISLKKEIEFIQSFISLMQLRFPEKVDISLVLPDEIPDIQIPPMLFISLLENAFKHGVSYQAPSFIYFKIEVVENALQCQIRNSKQANVESRFGEYSGIGLDNIKKSLELLYEDDYSLRILDHENEFEVKLSIPI